MRRTARHAGLAALVAVALAGCSDRAGTSTETPPADGTAPARPATPAPGGVGDAVANGGRAADAAVETLDVKMALVADDRLDTDDVNVDTDHVTKTVRLRGSVPTEAQKTIAQQVAARSGPPVTASPTNWS